MGTATATATAAATVRPQLVGAPCGECGVPVVTRVTTDHRSVVLDAEPVPGGIFRIDRYGRAERRSLVLLVAERQAGAMQPGFDPHDCAPTAWYLRD